MEITVLKDDLQKALNIVSRFVSSRPTLPILSHILLEAKKGQLRLAATNLEVGISINVGANIKTEGITTVPAKAINEVITSLPKTQIQINQKEEMLNLSADGYSITLSTSPVSDLPSIANQITKGLVLNSKIFQKIAQKVVFSTANFDAKPGYSGVLFNVKDGNIDVVGTDGVRLSKISVPGDLGDVDKILIPATVVSEIPKIFEGEDLKISIDKEKSQILFGTIDRVLTAQLLSADFPDFEKIIPTGFKTRVVVDKEELLNAVQLAGIFAPDYKIEFSINDASVVITSNSPQLGFQTSSISAKVEGEEISVAFNWRFVREFLNAVSGAEVAMELNSPISPGVFKDPKEDWFLHLIMPIRSTS